MSSSLTALGVLALASAAVVSSVTGCNGCSKEDAAPPGAASDVRIVGMGEPPAEVGDVVSNAAFAMSVHRVKPCTVEPHLRPPVGVRKLGVHVTLEAVSSAQVPANVFYALLVAPDGERYEATLAGCRPVLEAQQLVEGEKTTGWITFDVPESVTRARFRYAPVVIGVGRPHLEFELGALAGATP